MQRRPQEREMTKRSTLCFHKADRVVLLMVAKYSWCDKIVSLIVINVPGINSNVNDGARHKPLQLQRSYITDLNTI